MQAMGDFIVVMPGEAASERKGILLPAAAREQSNRAEVVAVGPEVKNIRCGDMVLVPLGVLARVAHTQTVDMMIDDKPALIMQEKDVAVVWPKEDAASGKDLN